MDIDLMCVNGRIVSSKVYKIGQEMGNVKCDNLATGLNYDCKTFDDEHGIEHLVLVQYDPNIVAGRVKAVVVGSFLKGGKSYVVALMEDATLCVMGKNVNKKFYMQVSDSVKDMKIIKGQDGLKVMCKPLYSNEIKELLLNDSLRPKSNLAL